MKNYTQIHIDYCDSCLSQLKLPVDLLRKKCFTGRLIFTFTSPAPSKP